MMIAFVLLLGGCLLAASAQSTNAPSQPHPATAHVADDAAFVGNEIVAASATQPPAPDVSAPTTASSSQQQDPSSSAGTESTPIIPKQPPRLVNVEQIREHPWKPSSRYDDPL